MAISETKLVREFLSKGWNVRNVYKLLQNLRVTRTVDRRPDSRDAGPAQLIALILLTNWCWARKTSRRAIKRSVKSLMRRTSIGRWWPVSFTKTCVSSALRSDEDRSCLTPTAKLACRDRGCCFRSSRNMMSNQRALSPSYLLLKSTLDLYSSTLQSSGTPVS